MIKDFKTYISEGLFDRNQSEFNIRKTDRGVEQVYIPKTKEDLSKYIDIDIENAKKEGTYPNVNLNNIDVSELGNDELDGLFSSKIYMINPDISDWDIKSIPSKFFDSNEQIKEFTIPNSVTSIGYSAFSGCAELTSVTITNRVKSIGNNAFSYCSSLSSVTIPNSVINIGDNAFTGCMYLSSITIPNSVKIIGDNAFCYCYNLESVTIPNSVTSIGYSAFSICSGLKSVTIPNSVTSIGYSAFASCGNLTIINVSSDNPNYTSKDGVLFNKQFTILIQYPAGKQESYVIPNNVVIIGDGAFSGCPDLTSVTIPNGVTRIGKNAFWYCKNLKSIEIPDSVTNIGRSAFGNCDGLKSVTISKHCNIEKNSFPQNCKIIIK